MQKLYSMDEVSEMLGVSKSYLYKQVQNRNIWHRKIGNLIKFSDDDIEEFINREVKPIAETA